MAYCQVAESVIYELKCEQGVVMIMVDPVNAPAHCELFAKHVKDQVYRKTRFHQVFDVNLMGGKPGSHSKSHQGSGNYSQQEGTEGEFFLKHTRGAVGLGRTVGLCNPLKKTNSTQLSFFLKDYPEEDGEFTVFGYVIEGIEVLDQLAEEMRKLKKEGHAHEQEFTITRKRG